MRQAARTSFISAASLRTEISLHITSADGGRTFGDPIRVNATAGAAIATGTVRGGQLAVGGSGRVHVAWNGSRSIGPASTPMFYTRLNAEGTAFEPERNVMRGPYNIDGGGAVAADRNGHVYVVWHANAAGEGEEGKRRVWVARSDDDGRTFEPEHAVFDEPTGACGCCGLGAFADRGGRVHVLFRSAFEVMNRDMYLLTSRDLGAHFDGRRIDRWHVGMCVMSTQAFAEGASGMFTAWETKGQIYMGRIDPDSGNVSSVMAAPGDDRTENIRRSRSLRMVTCCSPGPRALRGRRAVRRHGRCSTWTVTRFGPVGHAENVPVWGLVAVHARPDGFTIL